MVSLILLLVFVLTSCKPIVLVRTAKDSDDQQSPNLTNKIVLLIVLRTLRVIQVLPLLQLFENVVADRLPCSLQILF